ncbi:MAG: hypothetical protein GX639_03825 [Fibrobacter sp.]|nr:hypothetical protein [Fibrobacter sp.]
MADMSNDRNIALIIMFSLLFDFFIFTLIGLKVYQPMFMYIQWKYFTKYATVNAKIIESIISESDGETETTDQWVYHYYPYFKVEFQHKGKTVNAVVSLTPEGYDSPDKAFSDIFSIAPNKKIKYIQTTSKEISYGLSQYLSPIRVHDNPATESMIKLVINDARPEINNYYFTKISLADWLLPLLFMVFGLVCLIPLIVIPELSLQFKLSSVFGTVLLIALFYTGIPVLLNKLNIHMASPLDKPMLEIIIDDSYDGSQLTPYLNFKPTEE